ncbi:MAG: HAMP domain-containing histidine kinase [Halobacteriovoraceae bacterium]|jgi:signal transduction histidine kinase|nr:HAMP domain-containing histidine kinase [Halobacteriovoraceae bacterium]MBT5094027.1 HAMP domain-containing histidine kinase [Halobacteriovoraceae bacterium]
MLKTFLKFYRQFTGYFHRVEDRFDPVLFFRVDLMVTTTLITGLLMWTYAFVAFNYVSESNIKWLGIVYALLHLLTPFVYRKTGSLILTTYVMLVPGGVFQTHFAVLTGGFFTSTLIWVGILPLIAGLLTNKKHTLIWSAIVCCIIFTVFMLDTQYHMIPNYLDHRGRLITQLLITYGMVFLNCVFTIFLLELYKINTNNLRSKAVSKQSLLHVMVHDISNPLSVINWNVGYLNKFFQKDENKIDDKISAKIKQTSKRVEDTLKIITAVREIEAFQTGKKALVLKPICLITCLENCVELVKPRMEKKKINIKKDFADIGRVLGNTTIVEQQIIVNILTNAIKFSPDEGVIELSLKEASEGRIELLIRDYGVGMPDYIIKNLFDPLAQTNRTGTDGEIGTGFGMPITKNSITLINGDISVESWEEDTNPNDSGTAFSLKFQKGEHEVIKPPQIIV